MDVDGPARMYEAMESLGANALTANQKLVGKTPLQAFDNDFGIF